MNKLFFILATLGISISAFACENSDQPTQRLEDKEVSSPYQASELALRNYIYYSLGEQVLKPALVGISRDIDGFAKSGDQVWEVRIVNKEKGLIALYFVSPKTGNVHMVCKPGQWQKNRCAKSDISE